MQKKSRDKKILLAILIFLVVFVLSRFFPTDLTGAVTAIAKKSACSQNYAVEAQTTCPKTFTAPGPDCSPSDYPSFYRSRTMDYSYCPNPTDCVHNFKCYPQNTLQTFGNEKLFCSGAYWWDFDNRKLACEGADVCGTYTITGKPTTWKWIESGDFYVGEYDLVYDVLNSGFEIAGASATDARDWTEPQATYQTRASDKAHNGAFSMRVSLNGQFGGIAVSSAYRTVGPQKYRLSGWIYNSLTKGGAYLDLKDVSWECSALSQKKNEWEYVSCEFTPPGAYALLTVRLVTDGYPVGTVWFDDIKIEEVDRNPECCGDDANEYVVTGTDGTTACCSKQSTDSFPVKVVNGMCVYKLGPWNSYTGGNAVNTWATSVVHRGGTYNFRVYEEGKLLAPKASPWGNIELGIFSDFRKDLENDVYIAPTQAIDPNTRTYEMQYCTSRPERPKYGINTHIPNEFMLDEVQKAGIRWIRVDFNWWAIEKSKGEFDWAVYDKIVEKAKERGIKIFATLAYSPAWTIQPSCNRPNKWSCPPNKEDWTNFVYQAVYRYKDYIKHWGMWNEPDISYFWGGDLKNYVDTILIPGYNTIKETDPDAKVVAPDNAYSTWQNTLQQLIDLGLFDYTDILAIHSYGNGDAVLAFGEIDKAYEIAKPYLSNKEFWVTETGAYSGGAYVTEETQKDYYEQTLNGMISRPYWTGVFFYELVDSSTYTTGILKPLDKSRTTFHYKKAYYTYKDFIKNNPASCSIVEY